MKDLPYIKFTNEDSNYLVVADLVSTDGGNFLFSYFQEEKVTELLDYTGGTEYSNRQRLYFSYTDQQSRDSFIGYSDPSSFNISSIKSGKDGNTGDDANLPLNIGSEILLPKSRLKTLSDSLRLSRTFEPSDGTKFNNFVSSTLLKLREDPNYIPATKEDRFIDFYPKITVFLWSRVLNQIVNISPFVHVCNTNSESNGSSFQLTLPPILGKYSSDTWNIDKGSITDFNNSKTFVAQSGLFKNKGLTKENDFYFHRIISPNDLIWVQYETLQLEKDLRAKDGKRYSVDNSEIPNRVYDLIGMVDSCSININPQAAEIGINVSGRDLTKPFLDDGSYFYIEEFAGALFPDNEQNKKISDRIYGRIEDFNTLGYRTIDQHIRTIKGLYSATGYVPNEIFEPYGDSRVTFADVDREQEKTFKQTDEGNKETALLAIKKSREFYKLTKSVNEDAEVSSIFNVILGLVKSDTLVVDQNILSVTAQNLLRNRLYVPLLVVGQSLNTNEFGVALNSVIAYNRFNQAKPSSPVTQKPLEGIWQIIDVEVDPSISNLILADTSIAEANGSILETIKSAAEEPFMEVFTDTYKDRFKLIARRQPFNKQYYNELVDDTVLDIYPEDVLSYNLNFDDSEVYTWYSLTPSNLFYGEIESIKGFIPPAVFSEYVDIWGSRPYNKTTTYKPFTSKSETGSKVNIDIRQAILDLQYMIEINAYLPFARKGSITINGDRRFKKKTAIRLVQTGEIYHINSLSNSYTKNQGIDRTTTLNVDHGLVEKYMRPSSPEDISYFNIVDTSFEEKMKQDNESGTLSTDIIKDWKVRPEVFDFFIKRKQFQ
jgi:hypothetical protein